MYRRLRRDVRKILMMCVLTAETETKRTPAQTSMSTYERILMTFLSAPAFLIIQTRKSLLNLPSYAVFNRAVQNNRRKQKDTNGVVLKNDVKPPKNPSAEREPLYNWEGWRPCK
jgi:hypothetical protein